MEPALVTPLDEFNQALLANVHPPGWVNPEPKPWYHLVVVGAGAGGLMAAIGAASVGARVAIVERALMGGDCLTVGCVPSKSLIRSSRAVREVESAERFGVPVSGTAQPDFGPPRPRSASAACISRSETKLCSTASISTSASASPW